MYIALSGAVLKQTQMETISQNLANTDTTAYKKDTVSFRDYLLPQDAAVTSPDGRAMTYLSAFKTDFSVGNYIKTGDAMNVAVDGDGFIALEGERYTRKGELKKDAEGYLTSRTGKRVMGSSGFIRIPEGRVEIDDSGRVTVNGVPVDSIKMVDFPQKAGLSKAGEGVFTASSGGTASKAVLKQGYLETSNVEAIREMVRMIETLREYESFQKAIQTFDEAAAKVNTEIGRM